MYHVITSRLADVMLAFSRNFSTMPEFSRKFDVIPALFWRFGTSLERVDRDITSRLQQANMTSTDIGCDRRDNF